MGDITESSTPPPRQIPFREDCWTEEATSTLVDAWGRRYLELNRGNLRQKDWQEVADTVNARHGLTKKTRRTDVQCKNRIDTLKKKYKVEKVKVNETNAPSTWTFFTRLDLLIGPNFNRSNNKSTSSPSPMTSSSMMMTMTTPLSLPSPPMAVPLSYRKPLTSALVTPVVLPQKRPAVTPVVDESYFRRNYSAMAAAAAAAEEEVEEEEESESEGGREVEMEEEEDVDKEDGMKKLAKAIEKFGDVYERIENMKQRSLVEMEKQKMQFAKEMEVQRMQWFMDTQVQLEKIKQAKRSGGDSDDIYS